MTDLMVPSKRPRALDELEYSESHTNIASDWFPDKDIGHVHVRGFLHLCRFCKRKLNHNEDIFMYGYFGAFCTKECRAKQMAYDFFMEASKEMAKAKKGRTCGMKPEESKDEGDNRETITSSQFYI